MSYEIAVAIENNDIDYFCLTLNNLFASIPYQLFQEKRESYFHSIVFIALRLCGFYIDAEISVSTGRIDAMLGYENRIYLFEFKLDQDAQTALQQIEQKEYFKKFLQQDKDIFLVGINFSSSKKEVENWIIKKIEQ